MGRRHVVAAELLAAAEAARDKYVRLLGLQDWQIAVELSDDVGLSRSTCYLNDNTLLSTYDADVLNLRAVILVNIGVDWDLTGQDLRVSLPHTIIHELWHVVEEACGVTAAKGLATADARLLNAPAIVDDMHSLQFAIHQMCDRVAAALFQPDEAV